MNWTMWIVAAISGFVSGVAAAVKVDHEAFKAHPNSQFDWKLAVARWIRGGVLGAIGAFGVGGIFQVLPPAAEGVAP